LWSFSAKKEPAGKKCNEVCCRKKNKISDDNNLIWETLSRQLIFIPAL